jgi:hypothetical protein
MKITPFQQALRNEMHRIEQLTNKYESSQFSILSLQQRKPIKNKHFLLQFFQHVLSF